MPSILKNHRYILFHSLATHHLIHLVYATTGIAIKGTKTHSTAFAVRLFSKRTTKGAGGFLPGKELCRALWEKATHSTVLCRA
jgi:hypothetical protein